MKVGINRGKGKDGREGRKKWSKGRKRKELKLGINRRKGQKKKR